VQDIVDELEESGREAGLICSPSREIKEELIERPQCQNPRLMKDMKRGGR